MARSLVERKLAACAQISEIESFYHWEGAVQHGREFRILFKTTTACLQALQAAIREQHSYELPAIYAVALEYIYPPYGAWVEGEVEPHG